MRHSLAAFMLTPLLCTAVSAQTTGRLVGKVTTKDGKPIADVKISIARKDINWVKEIKTDAKGNFMQVGLEPKLFDLTFQAKGYVDNKMEHKVDMGDAKSLTIVLSTPEQMGAVTATTPSVAASGTEAFNKAVGLVNQGNFVEALPLVEKAYNALQKGLTEAKEESDKKDINDKLVTVERVYATCLFETGKVQEANRKDLYAKAEPIVKRLFEASPKELRYATYLLDAAKSRQDAETEKKMQEIVDALSPVRPETSYNKAVEAFNNNDMKAAKAHLENTLKIDPKYAEAYYLLGMTEYGLSNMKATKTALVTYLELAPEGKNAAMVKEMLKDPSLKNIK